MEGLAASFERASELGAGAARHGALAACLVRAGELAQGIADSGDGGEEAAHAAMAVTTRVAGALWRSWRTGGASPVRPGAAALAALRARVGAATVRIRRPEGFALYALYPEQYGVAAARALSEARGATVIGIRSIGTSLAAIVASAAGARRVPLTVRPSGHPYARVLELPGPLARAIARPDAEAFAVVDEGPGLSGSSFAAVAEALLRAGVAPHRVHLFTGHPHPPGVHASRRVRELFARLPRHTVSFEETLLAPGPLSLPRLAEDAVGPGRVVDDLSGGRWRARLFPDERAWPPSAGWLERRKLLLEAGGETYLARFAGLGSEGERKLARAQALADAGVGVAPVALRHGFLLEPWLQGRPLSAATVPRAALLDAVGRLLRVSASRPRDAGDGAPPSELAEMARVNAAEALGRDAGEVARRLEDVVPEISRQARPVEVDGKMQAWEWLALPGGRVLKTDGIDHHAAHDLAGCQDALWDVAGAELELGLTEREALALAEVARRAGSGADPGLLPFYRTCFRALEVGRWSFALASEASGAERARRKAALERYRRALAEALAALSRATRRGARASAPNAPSG